MKTTFIFGIAAILFSTVSLQAQTKTDKFSTTVISNGSVGTTPVENIINRGDTQPVVVDEPDTSAPTINGGTITGRPVNEVVQPVDKKLQKRLHAEKMSGGKAFSGKGKGGEKNLVDPAPNKK